jgi:hypothetical protein
MAHRPHPLSGQESSKMEERKDEKKKKKVSRMKGRDGAERVAYFARARV